MRRTIRTRLLESLVLVALATSLAGCGAPQDDLPRQAVSGTVKFKGEPLKAGVIQFQPKSQGSSTAGAAGIVDGKYSIVKAEGLVPGSYQVTITSVAEAAKQTGGMPGDPVPPPKEPIPAKYNAKTTLTAEIKEGSSAPIDFVLEAK
jgi:hypothetical protein